MGMTEQSEREIVTKWLSSYLAGGAVEVVEVLQLEGQAFAQGFLDIRLGHHLLGHAEGRAIAELLAHLRPCIP